MVEYSTKFRKMLEPQSLVTACVGGQLVVSHSVKIKLVVIGAGLTSMPKEKRISVLALIVLTGFCISVFYHYVLGVYNGAGYPYNTFLFIAVDRFSDFYRVLKANQHLNPYFGSYRMLQYPLLNFLAYLFTLLPLSFAIFIYIVIFASFMVMAWIHVIQLQGQPTNWANVFILAFLTSPFLFEIDRGNFDGVIFIFLCLFIFFYTQKRFVLSSMFLSLAIAMKPFPAVFLLLFLADQKYKEATLIFLFTGLISLISLLAFQGGLWANLFAMLSIAKFPDAIGASGYFASNNFVFHSMSMFTIFKVYFIESGLIQRIDMSFFSSLYTKGVLLVFVPISLYVVFLEKELWKRVTILSITMVIFPQISGDYRLLYMFIPIFLFLTNETPSQNDYFYTVLFGLLLIPKNYYFLPNTVTDSGFRDFAISYPINFLIMALMLLSLFVRGMMESKVAVHWKNNAKYHQGR